MEPHDKFKECPPAPETLADINWLRPYQRDIEANTGLIPNGVFHGTNQFVPHLYGHKDNAIHYKNLKYLVELGVQVKQTHRVICCRQKQWLKPFNKFNTDRNNKPRIGLKSHGSNS